jgi:hypothetical protein
MVTVPGNLMNDKPPSFAKAKNHGIRVETNKFIILCSVLHNPKRLCVLDVDIGIYDGLFGWTRL